MTEIANPLTIRADTDVVLCGGTYQSGEHFFATTYAHEDDFGMLGGEMRIIAAVARARHGASGNVLFSGGKSKKGAAMRGGEHVLAPPAAAVYAAQFANLLSAERDVYGDVEADASTINPVILLDAETPNTNANMARSVQLAFNNEWESLAVITNRYHLPRVEALYSIIKEKLGSGVRVNFLEAEQVVAQAYPGVYDAKIAEAYASPAGEKRLASEAQGLEDIKAGRYSFKEVTRESLEVQRA